MQATYCQQRARGEQQTGGAAGRRSGATQRAWQEDQGRRVRCPAGTAVPSSAARAHALALRAALLLPRWAGSCGDGGAGPRRYRRTAAAGAQETRAVPPVNRRDGLSSPGAWMMHVHMLHADMPHVPPAPGDRAGPEARRSLRLRVAARRCTHFRDSNTRRAVWGVCTSRNLEAGVRIVTPGGRGYTAVWRGVRAVHVESACSFCMCVCCPVLLRLCRKMPSRSRTASGERVS